MSALRAKSLRYEEPAVMIELEHKSATELSLGEDTRSMTHQDAHDFGPPAVRVLGKGEPAVARPAVRQHLVHVAEIRASEHVVGGVGVGVREGRIVKRLSREHQICAKQ